MTLLLLHPHTQAAINNFVNQPAHALVLVGPLGAGKTALARNITATMLGVSEDKLSTHSYFMHVTPHNSSISIDEARQLQEHARLKTAGTREIRRAAIIEDAHYLTREAQNALLKLIEEPPADTCIILTVSGGAQLLPTILSRAQKITIKRPPKAKVLDYFKEQGHDTKDIERMYHLADGLPGLLTSLLTNADHPLLESIETAKKLFKGTAYERLLRVDVLSKQKEGLSDVLWAMEKIAHAALNGAIQKDDKRSISHWYEIQKIIALSRRALHSHPNNKLLLTNLIIQL